MAISHTLRHTPGWGSPAACLERQASGPGAKTELEATSCQAWRLRSGTNRCQKESGVVRSHYMAAISRGIGGVTLSRWKRDDQLEEPARHYHMAFDQWWKSDQQQTEGRRRWGKWCWASGTCPVSLVGSLHQNYNYMIFKLPGKN